MKKLLTFLSCVFVFACGTTSETTVRTLEPGEIAPDFHLKNIDGEMVSFEDYPNAKGFIVVFTCNSCPVANKYEDRIIALSKKYDPSSYPVIAINPNPPGFLSGETFEEMQEKAKAEGFSFPYLFDEGQKVTGRYGPRVTPHFFLLKKEGNNYKVAYTGALDNDMWDRSSEKTLYVEDAIAALEAGQEIKIASTKAIGCEVKRP